MTLNPERPHQLALWGAEDGRHQFGVDRLVAGMKMKMGLGVDGALAYAAVGEFRKGGAGGDALLDIDGVGQVANEQFLDLDGLLVVEAVGVGIVEFPDFGVGEQVDSGEAVAHRVE